MTQGWIAVHRFDEAVATSTLRREADGMTRATTVRRRRAASLAEPFGGVLSRRLLREAGVHDEMVRREVAADRWRVLGRQTVALHRGGLPELAHRWRGVWEVGARVAAVDGVTALQHAGLTGYVDPAIHVSILHTANVRRHLDIAVHQLGRRVDGEVVGVGLPRTRPSVAAVRAAHWSTSDRQAALVLAMSVQQRLCTGRQLLEAADAVRGRTRRAFIRTVVRDIALGAHSLGEIDVVTACRRRGLPEPDRQVVRELPSGRCYLDVRWARARLVVEVDGAQHTQGLAAADDALRQNAVVLGDDLVLRVPVIGWRLTRETYLDQVVTAYTQRVA